MKTYLELKDQVVDPPHPSPTYPERPNTPSPHKAQASKSNIMRETKKRSKINQTNKRQYKVMVYEKPLVLPRISATLIPTTASATPPMMSNPRRATTPWPSTFPASANLFVTRSWPIPPSKENNPAPAKQKMMGLELSKSENTPARKITTSFPLPSVMENSTTAGSPSAANIMAVSNMQSPGIRCKKWESSCPICTQSATPLPSGLRLVGGGLG